MARVAAAGATGPCPGPGLPPGRAGPDEPRLPVPGCPVPTCTGMRCSPVTQPRTSVRRSPHRPPGRRAAWSPPRLTRTGSSAPTWSPGSSPGPPRRPSCGSCRAARSRPDRAPTRPAWASSATAPGAALCTATPATSSATCSSPRPAAAAQLGHGHRDRAVDPEGASPRSPPCDMPNCSPSAPRWPPASRRARSASGHLGGAAVAAAQRPFHEALEVHRGVLAGEVQVPVPPSLDAVEAGVLAGLQVGVRAADVRIA